MAADGNGGGYQVRGREMTPITAGGRGRRLDMWRASSLGPNAVMQGSIETVRSRNRHAARNDAWAGAASDKLVSNMVATGIQAVTVNGSKEHRALVDKLWRRFMKRCVAEGGMDGFGQQALAVREWDEAGECFGRFRSRRLSDPLPVPLQIQLMEAEQCPSHYNSTAPNGNPIRMGVEFDFLGDRAAYWFYRTHPNDIAFTGSLSSSELTRIPAEEIIHLYEPMRVGQIRGIPRATSVLTRLFNLNNLSDAAVERNKIANLFGAFFTKKEGIPKAPGATILADTPENQAAAADGRVPNMDLEPATGMELPEGYDVKFSTPPGIGPDYFQIIRSELLAVAARHGVPYEVLTGDLTGVSDRALRLILNEFRRIIEQRLWLWMIPQFLQPIREAFFDAAVLAGKIDPAKSGIAGATYAEDREDFVETLWVPEGWPYSHPVQDVDADRKAIRAGLTSRTATILRNGFDPEQVSDDIERENADADRRGFAFDSDPRKTSNAGLTQARPAGTEIPPTDIRQSGSSGNGDRNPDPEAPPPNEPTDEETQDNRQ